MFTKLSQLFARFPSPTGKWRIVVYVLCFLAMIGGGVALAWWASGGPQPSTTPQELRQAESERREQANQALQSERSRQAVERDRALGFTYTGLKTAIRNQDVAFATVYPASYAVEVELRDGTEYELNYPPAQDENLADQLVNAGASVKVSSEGASGSSGLIRRVLFPLLIFSIIIGIVIIVTTRRGGLGSGGGAAKQSKLDNKQVAEVPPVGFADVAGCDEAVEEARELVDFLKRPERYRELGAKMPSGIIFHGAPGTGKTLLAKAVAGEAGVPFFAASGSEFVQMYVGVGAKRVRELFAQARKAAPAVIFLDEIDAIGKARGASGAGGNDEREQTLNQLLVELDGFTGHEDVVVIAATNRLDTLDPALLRPGRLTRHVHISSPAEDGRQAILRVHARSKPLHEDVNLSALAASTSGASGAELAEMLNEGAIMAVRDGATTIRHEHLWEGFLRVVAGPRKASSMLAAGEKEAVAYHESGHVLCAELCPTVDKTLHATINPRGQAAGFAVIGQSDRSLHTEQHIHEQLIYILGGRASEYVLYGMVSSGAANDLQKANDLARRAVEEYGLSERVGQVIRGPTGLSETMRSVADDEVRRLVEDAYREAIMMIREHQPQLELLAQSLITAGDIDRPEIAAAMDGTEPKARKPKMHVAPLPEPVAVPSPVRSRPRWRERATGVGAARRRAITALTTRTKRSGTEPSA